MSKGDEHRYREGRISVLHVDDDPAFLDVTRAYLDRELSEAEITTVTKPTAAVERLYDGSFDCVVSDYEMPTVDGLELLKRVREEYPELPFLLYTGKGSESIASRAINAGVTGYLQKGGTEQHERLANRIRHAVQEYRATLDSERYSTVLRALGYPTYVVDADGRFAYVNDAFADLTGYDREELVGAEPERVKTDASVEQATDALRSVISASGPDVEQFEITIRTADGDLIPCLDHIAPLPFETEYRGCAGILRDITSRRRRREELADKNERLEQFVSAAAHDLRTPLTTARTAGGMARKTREPEFFDRLEGAHERLEGMLDELLTLAREENDAAITEPTDLGEVGRAAWDSVGTDGVDFSISGSPTIDASPNRLRRLLENLLRNSVEHGSTGSHSQARGNSVEHGSAGSRTTSGDSVEHSSTSNRVEPDDPTTRSGSDLAVEIGSLDDGDGFYVADDGPGIPPEDRGTVFEPGYTTAADGTGFGLAIVSRIADAHGWEVAVAESESGGARFEVTNVELRSDDVVRADPTP